MGVATIPAVDIPGVEVQRTIDGSAAAETGIFYYRENWKYFRIQLRELLG